MDVRFVEPVRAVSEYTRNAFEGAGVDLPHICVVTIWYFVCRAKVLKQFFECGKLGCCITLVVGETAPFVLPAIFVEIADRLAGGIRHRFSFYGIPFYWVKLPIRRKQRTPTIKFYAYAVRIKQLVRNFQHIELPVAQTEMICPVFFVKQLAYSAVSSDDKMCGNTFRG